MSTVSAEEHGTGGEGVEKIREYAQQVYQKRNVLIERNVTRDGWLTDEESLRMACLSLAVSLRPFSLNAEDDKAETVTSMAEKFVEWVKGS